VKRPLVVWHAKFLEDPDEIDRLPRTLQCSRCGAVELIRDGKRKIRGHEDAVTDAKPKLTRKRVLTLRTPMPA
jgi:hypothetical protein